MDVTNKFLQVSRDIENSLDNIDAAREHVKDLVEENRRLKKMFMEAKVGGRIEYDNFGYIFTGGAGGLELALDNLVEACGLKGKPGNVYFKALDRALGDVERLKGIEERVKEAFELPE